MSTVPSHDQAAHLAVGSYPGWGGVDCDDAVSNGSLYMTQGWSSVAPTAPTAPKKSQKKSQKNPWNLPQKNPSVNSHYPPFFFTAIHLNKIYSAHSIITSISSITKTSDLEKIYQLFSPKFGMMITLRGTEIMQVRRGCNSYGATTHLAIDMQQGWHGTYLGLRIRVLLSVPIQYCQIT